MKKALNIIKTILVWLVVAAAVFMMIFTIVSVMTFDRNDRGLFGFKFFVVQTDSMSATDFSAGDIAVSKTVEPASLKEGDIITFISQNSESFGETITHKIRRLTTDAEGNPGFVTYGTTTDSDDDTVVTYPYVVGKYVGHIPGVGAFFLFLKTTPGYIVCIFVPFLLLILYQGLNVIRLFRKYKKEQSDALAEERRQIEEEKKQSAEMLQRLQELQAQLAAQGSVPPVGNGASVQAPTEAQETPDADGSVTRLSNGEMTQLEAAKESASAPADENKV